MLRESTKKTKYKSLDCSIMELADDIAYAVHNLEDAIALGIITKDDWKEGVEGIEDRSFFNEIGDEMFDEDHYKRKQAVSKLVNRFVTDVNMKILEEFHHPLLDMQAFVTTEKENEITVLKNLTYKKVIGKYEIKTLEYRGGVIINELYSSICESYEELLPDKYKNKIIMHERNSGGNMEKERIVCDYISGMTDSYATMLYNRIFTAGSGSIFTKL